MAKLVMKEMLDAGAHFGHQTQKWNPKMKPYIFGARRGIHIIDLEQTVPLCQNAYNFAKEVVAQGGAILFVGTKRQSQGIVEEQAKRCGMHHVNNRWLGGTLTNFKTVRSSVERLIKLEGELASEGGVWTKKERRGMERELAKLQKAFGGIKGMESIPAALFIIDPGKEMIAKLEANKLGVPVIAVTDTNCNPEGIDHIIPGNDDAIKSIRIFTEYMADACLAGLEQRQLRIREEVEADKKEEPEPKEALVHEVKVSRERAFVSREVKEEGTRRGKE